jgi:hypothetical protein
MKYATWVLAAGWVAVAACAARGIEARDLAVNVDGLADWMSSRAFIDASAMFRRWGMPGAGWQENQGLKLTGDNYPLGDADAVTSLRGYPDGVYKLRYEGSAAVGFSGIGAVIPESVKKAGGVTTAEVKIVHRGPEDLLNIQVRAVDPKDPLRNLQLLTPGYADAKQVFTNEFLRRVRPWPTIRFMDWQQTNASPVKEWGERATPGMFGRTSAKGVPLEEIVALANAVKRNVWVNIPQGASDDYVRQFATFLRDRLHAGAVIHFEYSNEVWNFGFEQAKQNLFAARVNEKLTKPKNDEFGRCAQNAADKLGRFARIFKEVFGDEQFAARVRPVVGGFIASSFYAQTQLDWLQLNHPGLVKEVAIAPYFGVEGDIKDVDQPGATADAMFAKLNALIDGQIRDWIVQHQALAQKHGVQLVAYEGGVHLTATNNVNEDLKRRMQADPRMRQTYLHLLDVWTKNGGGLFTQFGHIGPYTKFGFWGLLESADQRGSVKWDTFMSLLLPAGDANLDGTVDYADFKIVRNFLGRNGRWWEDGDFNADGKVDGEDLKLLKANLKDVTAEQKGEIEQFGR